MTAYQDFVASKLSLSAPTGIPDALVGSDFLFQFQADLVAWALRRGRAAVFAATGLGKSRMQLTWAHRVAAHTQKPVLILAPLAVSQQTADEAARIYVDATVAKDGSMVTPDRAHVYVTNYEKLHRFDPSVFGGVVWDESSICKSFNSKTLAQLLAAFSGTAFRLACTATPSPNDYTELGTHAELLGVCTRAEMLAEYFVHDGGETQKWRLKGHGRAQFWKFVASWAALVRSPVDLGYDGSAYELPELTVEHHVVGADDESVKATGLLFAQEARTLMERRAARRGSMASRVRECADLVNSDKEPWVVWCLLNDESEALAKAIPGAVEVRGSNTEDERERALMAFSSGAARVIISKASITGWGLNWQHCARVAFVGVDDSWESYHQAVRRCWRFGQTREVQVHLFSSELEGAVMKNLQRKESDAQAMAEELSIETAEVVRSEVRGTVRATNEYDARQTMRVPEWMTSEGGC